MEKEISCHLNGLYVDDESRPQTLVIQGLKHFAPEILKVPFAEIYEARSGAQAVEVAKRTHLDVIFFDLQLPWDEDDPKIEHGMGALKEVLRLQPDACYMIVSGHAHEDPGSVFKAGQLGIGAFVAKPVHARTLIDIVGVLLRGRIEARRRAASEARSSYQVRNGIHEAVNSLSNMHTALSKTLVKIGDIESFTVAKDLPLLKREIELVQRFGDHAGKSLGALLNLRSSKAELFDIRDILHEEIRNASLMHSEPGQKIEAYGPERIPKIKGIKEEFRQIISDLISNAVRALGKSGRVEIRVTTDTGEVGREIVLTIEDDGRGVSLDDKVRIHQPTMTVDGANKEDVDLALVRYFVSNFGGTISIKSEVGVGTCFTLRLPVYDNDPTFE
jgi:signal transduction histidine kinase